MNEKTLSLIGYASGLAGADSGVADGPLVVKESSPLAQAISQQKNIYWHSIISGKEAQNAETSVHNICESLANTVVDQLNQRQHFCVIGGDHTSALGTWSGVFQVVHKKGELGLIWIDAHMDSHTPETSESGRIHGMPLASLMGYGPPALTKILSTHPKLNPQNVCLIGVRSFENGEAELLKRLNVKVYYMDEIQERGFDNIFKEAIERVSKHTYAFGVSLDLDGIDPLEAPAVDVPEPYGLVAKDIKFALSLVANNPKLIGVEIVEFDPHRDEDNKTLSLIVDFIKILSQGVKEISEDHDRM